MTTFGKHVIERETVMLKGEPDTAFDRCATCHCALEPTVIIRRGERVEFWRHAGNRRFDSPELVRA